MTISIFKSVFVRTAVAAAALCGCVGSAQAIAYTGSWDPTYGGIFPALGWSASAKFDVPASCLVSDGSSLACPGVTFQSVKVDFYNAVTSAPLESFTLNNTVIVNGINVTGGVLSGIDTGFFGSFIPTTSFAGGGQYAFSLILFGGTQAQLIYATPVGTSPTCANPFTPVPGATCGVSALAASGTISPAVPEPATYALMLAGLGAAGWMARRRRV